MPGIAMRTVVPRVVQVRVPGSSVFVLLDDRVTLIDTGTRQAAATILAALRRLGRSPDEVEQILITHQHFDHIGGLAALQRELPARTGIHAADAPAARGEVAPVVGPPLVNGVFRVVGRLAAAPPARVDTLLHHGDELSVLGGLRVVHTPGHTPGHIALHLPDLGLLIAGDALQVGNGGRLMAPSRLFTQDHAEAVRSLRQLLGVDFSVLALSHFAPQRYQARDRLSALADAAGVLGTP